MIFYRRKDEIQRYKYAEHCLYVLKIRLKTAKNVILYDFSYKTTLPGKNRKVIQNCFGIALIFSLYLDFFDKNMKQFIHAAKTWFFKSIIREE